MDRDQVYLLEIVWDTIQHDLPRLITLIEPLVPPQEP